MSTPCRTSSPGAGRARPPAARIEVTEFLIKWKGYSTEQNTWEPAAHVPDALVTEFNESRVGLHEETENDDSSEGADSEGEQNTAPAPPCAKRKSAPARARQSPSAKRAAVGSAGSSSATGSRSAGKRIAADSSDEEAAAPAPKRSRKAAQPKAQPKGKAKAKGKGKGK